MSRPRKKLNVPPGVAHGYVRVSHRKQEVSGLSLEAQERKIRDYASYRSLSLVEPLYVDSAVSASKTRLGARPAGSQLVAALRPGDHVIVAKLDRAWRNASDALGIVDSWLSQGVTLHLLDINVDTSTPLGKVFFTILAAFAEWEASQISERTTVGLEQARLRGSPTKPAPFGFKRLGGAYVPVFPDLLAAKALIVMQEAQVPFQTHRHLLLNEHGFRTATGKEWNLRRMRDILDTLSPQREEGAPHRAAVEAAFAALPLTCTAQVEPVPSLTFRGPDGRSIFPAASWRP